MVQQIEEEAEYEKTDKSTVARKLIATGIREIRRERALEDYRRGRCTVWKAAEEAELTLCEMIELLRQERIPLHISREDVDQAWREAVEEG